MCLDGFGANGKTKVHPGTMSDLIASFCNLVSEVAASTQPEEQDNDNVS